MSAERRSIALPSALVLCLHLLLFPIGRAGAEEADRSDGDSPAKTANPAFRGIKYELEIRERPRPLRVHILRIAQNNAALEIATAVADDPDGKGPAEAQLVDPIALARKHNLVAAVNANAFAGLPDAEGKSDRHWTVGKPVDIIGWAVADGLTRSQPQKGYWCFWVDAEHQAHIGNLSEAPQARAAAAGFEGLIQDGRILPHEGGALHPRTAVGFAEAGRIVCLVVVDGRQQCFSEGASSRELAEIMRDLGCDNAVNLDGGGSSIMLLADADGALQVKNNPSDRDLLGRIRLRPVPVMLGVREAQSPR